MLFTPQPSLPEGNGWMDVMFRALRFLPTGIVGVSTCACIAETKQEPRLLMLKFHMLFLLTVHGLLTKQTQGAKYVSFLGLGNLTFLGLRLYNYRVSIERYFGLI